MSNSKSKRWCIVLLFGFACCGGLPSERLAAQPPVAEAEDASAAAAPTKDQLIATLRQVFRLLDKEDYVAASQYFVLPPNFQPEMLNGFIQRSEISSVGIDVLERDAAFGKAVQTFGGERAAHHANRAKLDVQQCYGFYHRSDEGTGEVMAFWDGNAFKLLRLDDVGKLSIANTAAPQSVEPDGTSGGTTMPELAKLNPTQIAATPALKPVDDLAAIAQRLPELEAATTDNPLDVAARANFAMALYQLGNLPRAWTQLRVALKVNPKHGGVAKGLATVFAKWDAMGVFTVGVPPQTVTGLLGDPDERVELGEQRERYVYAHYGIDFQQGRLHETVDLRTATESMFRPREIVSADLDGRGWRCVGRHKGDGQVTALYYLPGQSNADWTEQVEVQRIIGAAAIGNIEQITEKLLSQVKSVHPDMQSHVLDTQEDSVIVALELPGSPKFAKRHQLVRLFVGYLDVHRLAYTLKVDQPSKETQSKWLAIMKAASLEKVEY
ncbi:tetratricopeptide repeat protein [Roseimaritima ulvae]|uniref:Uncharacterized protein n=1 Tax=Roseimaritima ulvae TaxID=980254 RepID=A0A5B9R1Q7_9BACT|nr:hypothetical protein [Roseimaritima ulvae]QEG40263.1 hypothetical protein UC8_22700 [Roseimaritima ulvae]